MKMFKKKEKVPKIPLSAQLPDLSVANKPSITEESDLPELPSLPNNSRNNNLNQEIVKSAISDNFSPEENEVEIIESPLRNSGRGGENKKTPRISQDIENPVSFSQRRSSIADVPSPVLSPKPFLPVVKHNVIPRAPVRVPYPSNVPLTSRECLDVEPIFIRIDKFHLAKKNIEQIKNKVKEIESIIERVKQVKIKEEEEIKSWLEEVEQLKVRLSEIDSDVFCQI